MSAGVLHRALIAATPPVSDTTEFGGSGRTPGDDDADVDTHRYPQVPGYEVMYRIGSGGMGVVFHARQVSLGRSVALKFLRNAHFADHDQRSRFQAEAAAVARLRHPNIVQIHDYGVVDDCPYLVLELVDGGTLAQRIAGVPQPALKCADEVAQLALAVQHAHELGLIHRDLKPANILITPDGVLKIADFGLVKQLEPVPGAAGQSVAGNMVMGTPGYMAPEQIDQRAGEIGPHTDVYALGVMLFELLSGQLPFTAGSAYELLRQIQESDPILLRKLQPALPRDLETICLKCLQKDPADRYPSAAAMAGDLRRFRLGEPITARPMGHAERITRWCRRHPAVTGLTAALALTLLSGLCTVSIQWWRAEQLRAVAETNLWQSRTNLNLAVEAVDKFCSRVTEDPRLMENDLRPLRHHLLETAVEFHRQLLTQRGRSVDSQLDLARANARLGRLTGEIGAGKEAIDALQTAICLFEQIAEHHVDTLHSFVADWCECQSDLGLLYENQGDSDRAEDAYQQVIQRLATHDNVNGLPSPSGQLILARVWGRLSALYRHFGDATKAEATQLEAIRLCENLLLSVPEDATVRAELVINCIQLGELYQFGQLRRWREAQPYYDRALTLQTELLRSDPDSPGLIATQVRILRNLAAHPC